MIIFKIILLCCFLSITQGVQKVQTITTSEGFTFKIDLGDIDSAPEEPPAEETAQPDEVNEEE